MTLYDKGWGVKFYDTIFLNIVFASFETPDLCNDNNLTTDISNLDIINSRNLLK